MGGLRAAPSSSQGGQPVGCMKESSACGALILRRGRARRTHASSHYQWRHTGCPVPQHRALTASGSSVGRAVHLPALGSWVQGVKGAELPLQANPEILGNLESNKGDSREALFVREAPEGWSPSLRLCLLSKGMRSRLLAATPSQLFRLECLRPIPALGARLQAAALSPEEHRARPSPRRARPVSPESL